MKKLNLGCGTKKIPGCDNADSFEGSGADFIFSMLERFPFEDETYDIVYLFHVIEHIPRQAHPFVLNEIHRILKPEGRFIVSYPEFAKCAEAYLKDHEGQKDFFERTIFGRGMYPGDNHVCAMVTLDFCEILDDNGFEVKKTVPEKNQPFNTVVKCTKTLKPIGYELLLYKEVFDQNGTPDHKPANYCS